MNKSKLEYIWLDGYTPEPNLRAKTKIWKHEGDGIPAVEDLPQWGFDGSSTMQAEGSDSDCLLKPVRILPDPGRLNAYLVMCEVFAPDHSPHPSPDGRHIAFVRTRETLDMAALASVGHLRLGRGPRGPPRQPRRRAAYRRRGRRGRCAVGRLADGTRHERQRWIHAT